MQKNLQTDGFIVSSKFQIASYFENEEKADAKILAMKILDLLGFKPEMSRKQVSLMVSKRNEERGLREGDSEYNELGESLHIFSWSHNQRALYGFQNDFDIFINPEKIGNNRIAKSMIFISEQKNVVLGFTQKQENWFATPKAKQKYEEALIEGESLDYHQCKDIIACLPIQLGVKCLTTELSDLMDWEQEFKFPSYVEYLRIARQSILKIEKNGFCQEALNLQVKHHESIWLRLNLECFFFDDKAKLALLMATGDAILVDAQGKQDLVLMAIRDAKKK